MIATADDGSELALGIDENGLGPRLGPLVVTAVLARVARMPGAARALRRKRANVGDSKRLVAFGETALGEAWARAVAARTGAAARGPSELVRALALDGDDDLRRPCPSAPFAHDAQCWRTDGEAFVADDVLLRRATREIAKLAARGIDLVRAEVAIVCTRRLNDAARRGLSRFDVDLHTMERLALSARRRAGVDLAVTCGKVGGFDRYEARFGPMGGWLSTPIAEGRARSEYRIPGLGRIAFLRDAEDAHLLVGIASLVGKWVRDLLMMRIVRFHQGDLPDLPDASGYHDPVTTRFIDASALARKARGLDDDCFERLRRDEAAWSARTSEPAPGPARRGRKPKGEVVAEQ